MSRADTPELAALRARTMRREQDLQRDAYRHINGRHITDTLIGGIGVVLAVVALASCLSGCGGGTGDGQDDGQPWVRASDHAPTIGTVIALPPVPASAPVGDDGGA